MLLKRINVSTVRSKRTEIPQTHEGENTTLYNLLDSAKLVLRGKFIAMQTFKKKNKQTNT